jgi:ferritin-like metal-binding protein YciE
MPEQKQSEKKLIQYLNEAYGKERELETALEAHIGMTDRAPYKKRLQQHLRETKQHARKVEQRIKKLGGTPQPVQAVVGKATAALKGPLHALRGSGTEEKLLKNAKTEYSEEAEEIATYTAIEEFATAVGDRDTARLAREIRRDEEKMARFLERQIPQLAKAVVRAEVPASERAKPRRRRSSSSSKSRSKSSGGARSASSRAKSTGGSRRSRGNGSSTRSRSRSRSGSTSRSRSSSRS